MSFVGIPSYIDDPNYRYKMPRVRCKVEGSGNGIRTNLMNTRDISTAVKRAPEYLTKWLGIELCSQARYFADEGKAILQGVHKEEELQMSLDKFIEKYVLCPSCNLPEIDITIEGKKTLGAVCNACGGKSVLDSVHRVAAFILKNPPQGSTVVEKKKKRAKDDDSPKVKIRKRIKKEAGDEEKKNRIRVKRTKFKCLGSSGDKCVVRFGLNCHENGSINEAERFSADLRAVHIAEGFRQHEKVYVAIGALILSRDVMNNFATESEAFEADGDGCEAPVVAQVEMDIDGLTSRMAHIEGVVSSSAVNAEDILRAICDATHRYVHFESAKKKLPLFVKWLYDSDLLTSYDILQYFSEDREVLEGQSAVAFETMKAVLQPLLNWLNEEESESEYEGDDSSESS